LIGERGVEGYYEFAYDCEGRISSIKRAVDPTPLEVPSGSKKASFEVGWVDGKSKLISLMWGRDSYNPYANDILAMTKAMYNQKPAVGVVKEFGPLQQDQRGAAGALLEKVYGDPAYHIADPRKQVVGFKSLVAGAKDAMSTGFKNGEKVYTVVRRTNTGQVVETLSAFKSDTSRVYEQVLRLKYNNPELEVVEVGLSGSVVKEEGLSISGIVDSNNKLLYELLLHYVNQARPEKGTKNLIAISVTKRHHQGLRIGFVEREGKKVGLHIAEPGQFVLEDPLAQEFIQANGIKVSDGVMIVKDAVGKKIEVPTKIYDLELMFEGEPGVLEFAPSIYDVENLDSAFKVKFGPGKCSVAPPASATATPVIPNAVDSPRITFLNNPVPEPGDVALYHGTNELVLLYLERNGINAKTFFAYQDSPEITKMAKVVKKSLIRNSADDKKICNVNNKIMSELILLDEFTLSELEALSEKPVILRVRVREEDTPSFVHHKLEDSSITWEWVSKAPSSGYAEVLRVPSEVMSNDAELQGFLESFIKGTVEPTKETYLGDL